MTEQFKESINDLKNQLATFIKDYYEELLKIWKEITAIKTNMKFLLIIYTSVISIITSVLTAAIIHLIKN